VSFSGIAQTQPGQLLPVAGKCALPAVIVEVQRQVSQVQYLVETQLDRVESAQGNQLRNSTHRFTRRTGNREFVCSVSQQLVKIFVPCEDAILQADNVFQFATQLLIQPSDFSNGAPIQRFLNRDQFGIVGKAPKLIYDEVAITDKPLPHSYFVLGEHRIPTAFQPFTGTFRR